MTLSSDWHELVRYVSDPHELRVFGRRSLLIASGALVLAAIGLVLALTGITAWGWLAVGVGGVSVALWSLVTVNHWVASTWTGDDLIEIVVAEEGVIVQGGLAVTWDEIADIRFEVPSQSFQIRLKRFREVKARAVSRTQRLVLFGPLLGDPGYLWAALGGRSADQMFALLTIMSEQSARHCVPLVNRSEG